MVQEFTAFVGTVGIGGSGIWRSTDSGDTWHIPKGSKDYFMVCALTTDVRRPDVVFAGGNDGLYRSDNRGANFHRVECPINGQAVWSVATHPADPDEIFVGCRPGAIFRSKDGGERWEKLPMECASEGLFGGPPRVLSIVFDPTDHNIVWAGVEADGIRRSTDGGDTWTRVGERVIDMDIHGIAVSAGSPTEVFVSTEWEVYRSMDTGESWDVLGAKETFPIPYCRGLAIKANDPNVIFLGNGDSDIGQTGTVQRSVDRGATWETLPLPVEPNSPIGYFATNPADPDLVLCHSNYGEVFVSDNAGDSWKKVRREFSEIRAIAWTPN